MKLSEILFEKLELVNWDLYCELVGIMQRESQVMKKLRLKDF